MGQGPVAADVFVRAVKLPPAERDGFLRKFCGGDTALRERVERLLDLHDRDGRSTLSLISHEAETVIGPPAGAEETPSHEAPLREGPGSRIGPYRLMQLLGEGGFGSVFLAEQDKPVSRKVALKVIKLGMDTRQVVARFEQERQALAVMDHPNIAKVFDAGATETGRPYFVMELVKGEPITAYCDKHNLTTRERLDLFRTVCLAVQHAHTKGIIHRDLKPGNVLVAVADGAAVPKVIDFGVAKATASKLTEKTLFTEHRQLVGTPEYMSPEQAEMSGVDIDTRSDVYSLGVLLYELLTGTTPFEGRDLRSAAFGEIQRIIREVEPPRPSTRLSTLEGSRVDLAEVAARRRTEPRKLQSAVRGELDWIVMKALEKDRTRRYDTASSFAADIGRYLGGEAVEAGPPSAAYRLSKLVRRHRVGIGVGAAAVVTLAAATVVSGVQAARATRAERRAIVERDSARTVGAFLSEMLASVDPAKAKGDEVTVREALDQAAGQLTTGGLAEHPEVKATLLDTIGTAYFQLGRYAEAEVQLAAAGQLWTAARGPDDPETLMAQGKLAAAVLYQGRLDDTEGLLDRVIEARRRTLGEEHADTLVSLSHRAMLMQDRGRLGDAAELHRRIIDVKKSTLGPQHRVTVESLTTLADVLEDDGKLSEALVIADEAVEAATAAAGADDPLTFTARSVRASVLSDMGRYPEAEAELREVVAAKVRVFGEDHPEALTSQNILAMTLENAGRPAESVEILRSMEPRASRTLGPEHNSTLTYKSNLARSEQLIGNLDEAERLFTELLAASRRVRGEHAQDTLIVQNNLALLLQERKKPAEAEPMFAGVAIGLARILPADHWMRAAAVGNWGDCLRDLHRWEEAEAKMIEAYEGLTRTLGEGHDRTRKTARNIAELYTQWEAAAPGTGKGQKAAEWSARATGAVPPGGG